MKHLSLTLREECRRHCPMKCKINVGKGGGKSARVGVGDPTLSVVFSLVASPTLLLIRDLHSVDNFAFSLLFGVGACHYVALTRLKFVHRGDFCKDTFKAGTLGGEHLPTSNGNRAI